MKIGDIYINEETGVERICVWYSNGCFHGMPMPENRHLKWWVVIKWWALRLWNRWYHEFTSEPVYDGPRHIRRPAFVPGKSSNKKKKR